MAIVTTMAKLLLAMGIGFFMARKGRLDSEVNARLSWLIVNITAPLLTIYSISTVGFGESGVVLRVVLYGLAAYVVLYPLAGWLFTKIIRLPKNLHGTYLCMVMFANTGFMGYPVVQSLYGDSAIFYITMFNFFFNLIFFSFGIAIISRDAALSGGEGTKNSFNVKKLINPGIISALLALAIYFLKLPLPDIVYSCCGFVGDITPALSMVVIGASMAFSSFREIRTEKGLIPLSVVRLLIMPLIVFFLLSLTSLDPVIVRICAISAGMPVAAMTAMAAGEYPEQNRSSSIGVAVTTLASMITIPIMALIFG